MGFARRRWFKYLLTTSLRRSAWARLRRAEMRVRFPGALISSGSVIPDGDISIGEGTYGQPIIRTFGRDDRVSIGRYCSIGEGVLVLAGGNHDAQRPALYPFRSKAIGRDVDSITKGPIVIGHDVWIGARAIILSGVSIGNGAVIGAGTVVSRDVPAFGVVVGSPATLVRYRHSEADRQALERIAWWDWPSELIGERIDSFYRPLAEFIETFDTRDR